MVENKYVYKPASRISVLEAHTTAPLVPQSSIVLAADIIPPVKHTASQLEIYHLKRKATSSYVGQLCYLLQRRCMYLWQLMHYIVLRSSTDLLQIPPGEVIVNYILHRVLKIGTHGGQGLQWNRYERLLVLGI